MNEIIHPEQSEITTLGKCRLTQTAAIVDPNATEEECLGMLGELKTYKRAVQFWIGDLLNEMNHRYGEKFKKAAEITGLDEKTLADYCSICYAVEKPWRHENLSFEHHREVRRIEGGKEQRKWLDLAYKNKLSTKDLRESVRCKKVITQKEIGIESGKNSGLPTPNGAVMQLNTWVKNVLKGGKVERTQQAVDGVRSEIMSDLKVIVFECEAWCQGVEQELAQQEEV